VLLLVKVVEVDILVHIAPIGVLVSLTTVLANLLSASAVLLLVQHHHSLLLANPAFGLALVPVRTHLLILLGLLLPQRKIFSLKLSLSTDKWILLRTRVILLLLSSRTNHS
jgi:hypothetical protein